jgi:hypothetical protein
MGLYCSEECYVADIKQSQEAEEEMLRLSPAFNPVPGLSSSAPDFNHMIHGGGGGGGGMGSARRRSVAVEEAPQLVRAGISVVPSADELSPLELTERAEWDWALGGGGSKRRMSSTSGTTTATSSAVKSSSDSLASMESGDAVDYNMSTTLAPPHPPMSSTCLFSESVVD